MSTASKSPSDFLQRFIMARTSFQPQDFSIDMEKVAFTDLLAEEFNGYFRGVWTVDEMLLHPREALAFCDHVRRKHAFFYLPDDIVLRTVLNRRKSPAG